ncbi:MAG: amylosucrase [bacterium]|nr:amylosucrase [bacterium]
MAHQTDWYAEHAALTLSRITPRLLPILPATPDRDVFLERLNRHLEPLFRLTHQLYGDQYDFFYQFEQLIHGLARAFLERSPALRQLDASRESEPAWFQHQTMMGAVCYVDRFAGNLQGIRNRIPYFKELGLTYLHLMPLFKVPERNNDGGYAVSSFRDVNPALGTMAELETLTDDLRAHGISLVLDFVFNHTSDEHEWARKAQAGDKTYQAYYWLFDDRTLPDEYERHLREIFPEHAPGSFTFREDMQKWVWTTFYPFQWDLNYRNPEVFRDMLGEILFLANRGVDVLRLDAVPFVWKELGTNCENLPQAHWIIQALNAAVQIVCPSLLFKSEAIVHPRDVRSYIGGHESQLSYNPILMVSIWEALATRETALFRHTMNKHFALNADCAWINYLRSHDDIGWGFADEDAAEIGINGYDHRYFLNLFYTGRFPGSFAAGLPFNFNPRTMDMRISGTLASLAGLETAIQAHDDSLIQLAIDRILMMFGVILSAGGIPLIYLGDELGTLNDYSYANNPETAQDNRWVHRPVADPERWLRRTQDDSIEGRIFQPLRRMIAIRKRTPQFANGQTRFIDVGNGHLLGFVRREQLLVLANFSEKPQSPSIDALRQAGFDPLDTVDLLTERPVLTPLALEAAPYQMMWLVRRST